MNIEVAEVELYLRKYQWALKDFTRETEEGFPFLRTLPSRSVQAFLIYVQQFSLPEQLELTKLIVKHSNRPAMKLLGEEFINEDEARIKTYGAEVRKIVLPVVNIDPATNAPLTKTFAVKRADAAKIVLPVLSSAFGKKPEKFESLNWFYTIPVGDWQFYTNLDFSGTWGTEIRYSHRLVRNDGKSWGLLFMPLQSAVGTVQISQGFSLLSLYGFGYSPYYIYSMDDVQAAAQSILATHQRLFQEVPNWVDHLTID
jgi:hypothetical protein